MQGLASGWRARLRESSESVGPVSIPPAAGAQAKPTALVPRRSTIKQLVIEPQPASSQPSSTLSSARNVSTASSAIKTGDPLHVEAVPATAPISEQFGDFTMTPSETVLKKFNSEQLAAVHDFTVRQKGVGSVRWLRHVDLREVSLKDFFTKVVLFEPKQVTVYPDSSTKPARGEGLNVPAEIRLERCWPVNRATRQPITDPGSERYKEHLERLRSMPETHFVDFERETGTWVFRVDHFSKYGAPDAFSDSPATQDPSQNQELEQPQKKVPLDRE